MKHILRALALLLMISPLHAEDKAFIKFGYSGLWGSGYWTIWEDDRMEYEGRDDGAFPKMKGWRWIDRKARMGHALYRNEGAWDKARAIADAALKDRDLSDPATSYPDCTDVVTTTIWLTGGDTPDIVVIPCASRSGGRSAEPFYRRVSQLLQDLEAALETASVMPPG
jgi:hypothetical protein